MLAHTISCLLTWFVRDRNISEAASPDNTCLVTSLLDKVCSEENLNIIFPPIALFGQQNIVISVNFMENTEYIYPNCS